MRATGRSLTSEVSRLIGQTSALRLETFLVVIALGALAFKIDTAAAQLTGAGDVADARVKFGALSEAIDAYMTNNHLTPPEGVRVAVCPMQMKPWLQQDGTLRNPYYGSQMLTCGSFRNN